MLDDVRSRGKSLVGDRAGLWRYRVGDCGVTIAKIGQVLLHTLPSDRDGVCGSQCQGEKRVGATLLVGSAAEHRTSAVLDVQREKLGVDARERTHEGGIRLAIAEDALEAQHAVGVFRSISEHVLQNFGE